MSHSQKHQRRSIRLQGYDYTRAGAYFLTLCTHRRAHLFGTVVRGSMVLNDAGRVAADCWRDIPNHFPHARLDEFVIMPNHIHGIILITEAPQTAGTGNPVGAEMGGPDIGAKNFSPQRPPHFSPQRPTGTSKTIGSIVRGFKIGVTKWMRQNTTVHEVWQRNYYEHIVRNETELNRIRHYIIDNPAKWDRDRENTDHRTGTGRAPNAVREPFA